MRTKVLTVALILCAVLALAGFTYRPSAGPRWEYLTAPVADDAAEDRTLKNLGGGGWELVTVREASQSGRVLYFKRPL
jgi:hypothetical protein